MLVALACLDAAGAYAAELARSDNQYCDWDFVGPVADSDADKLEQMTGTDGAATLCLDSPGGDLLEAADIFQLVQRNGLHTRILPGQKCLGACALVFLGGAQSDAGGAGRVPLRELWAGGQLSIRGGQRAFSGQDDPTSGYDLLRWLFAYKLAEDKDGRILNDHVFLHFLSGDEDFVIDTVGDALLSDIPVMGVSYPRTPQGDHVAHICDAAFLTERMDERQVDQRDRDFLSTAHDIAQLRGNRSEPLRTALEQSEDGRAWLGFAGPYPSGSRYWQRECFVTLVPDDIAAYDGRRASDGITGVAVEFRDAARTDRAAAEFNYDAWSEDTRLVGAFDVAPLAMFPFESRINDLPRSEQAAEAAVSVGQLPPLPAAAHGFARFDGMDLPGGDIGRTDTASGRACMAACRADSAACDAATFDRWNQVCFLKSFSQTSGALFARPKSETYVAGAHIAGLEQSDVAPVILRRSSKGFFDRPDFYFDGPSFDACETRCLDSAECGGFNYIAAKGVCQVFSQPSEFFDRDGYEIGLKYQPH